VFGRVVLSLHWFRDATAFHRLAADRHISIVTAYRYLGGSTALAAHTRDLAEVPAGRRAAGNSRVILDGILIRTTGVAGTIIEVKAATPAARSIAGTPANTAATAATCSTYPPQTGFLCGTRRCCPGPETVWTQPAPIM